MPARPFCRHRPPARAFTLVELLVVIGVIALLISILMPVLSKARAAGLQSVCLSNMRQVGTALQMYLQESKGVLPPHVPNYGSMGVVNFADEDVYGRDHPNTLGSLMPYLKNTRIFACPALDPARLYFGGMASTDQSDTNYMGNGVLAGRKIATVRKSAEIVYLQEWAWRSFSSWCRPDSPDRSVPTPTYTWWHSTNVGYEEYTNVHRQGGNLVFADGHGEWRPYKSMHAWDFGLTGGPEYSGDAADDWTKPHWYTYKAAF